MGRGGEPAGRAGRQQRARTVDQAAAVGRVTGAGDERAGVGVAHIAERVDRDQRADDHVASRARSTSPMPPRIARGRPNTLPTLAPGAGADVALGHEPGGRAAGRLVAHLARRAHAAIAQAEVEEERAGYVRDHRGTGRVAATLLLEPAQHAPDGLAAEAAASAEDDAVDGADEVPRVEVVETDDVVGPPRSSTPATAGGSQRTT